MNSATHFRQVFLSNYSDLGIYRWMNRNKGWLLSLAFASGSFTFGRLSIDPTIYYYGTYIWFGVCAFLVFAGAVDHFFFITRAFNRTMNDLNREGYRITLDELKSIVKPIQPK